MYKKILPLLNATLFVTASSFATEQTADEKDNPPKIHTSKEASSEEVSKSTETLTEKQRTKLDKFLDNPFDGFEGWVKDRYDTDKGNQYDEWKIFVKKIAQNSDKIYDFSLPPHMMNALMKRVDSEFLAPSKKLSKEERRALLKPYITKEEKSGGGSEHKSEQPKQSGTLLKSFFDPISWRPEKPKQQKLEKDFKASGSSVQKDDKETDVKLPDFLSPSSEKDSVSEAELSVGEKEFKLSQFSSRYEKDRKDEIEHLSSIEKEKDAYEGWKAFLTMAYIDAKEIFGDSPGNMNAVMNKMLDLIKKEAKNLSEKNGISLAIEFLDIEKFICDEILSSDKALYSGSLDALIHSNMKNILDQYADGLQGEERSAAFRKLATFLTTEYFKREKDLNNLLGLAGDLKQRKEEKQKGEASEENKEQEDDHEVLKIEEKIQQELKNHLNTFYEDGKEAFWTSPKRLDVIMEAFMSIIEAYNEKEKILSSNFLDSLKKQFIGRLSSEPHLEPRTTSPQGMSSRLIELKKAKEEMSEYF